MSQKIPVVETPWRRSLVPSIYRTTKPSATNICISFWVNNKHTPLLLFQRPIRLLQLCTALVVSTEQIATIMGVPDGFTEWCDFPDGGKRAHSEV